MNHERFDFSPDEDGNKEGDILPETTRESVAEVAETFNKYYEQSELAIKLIQAFEAGDTDDKLVEKLGLAKEMPFVDSATTSRLEQSFREYFEEYEELIDEVEKIKNRKDKLMMQSLANNYVMLMRNLGAEAEHYLQSGYEEMAYLTKAYKDNYPETELGEGAEELLDRMDMSATHEIFTNIFISENARESLSKYGGTIEKNILYLDNDEENPEIDLTHGNDGALIFIRSTKAEPNVVTIKGIATTHPDFYNYTIRDGKLV